MSGEDYITSWFAHQITLDPVCFPIGIGDDMAQVCAGSDVLITTDILLDGTHFDLTVHPLEQVGFKAMNVNLSDCAAMATMPVCAVCAVALPKSFKADQLKELYQGIRRAGDVFDCPLIGGDITSWTDTEGRFAINITLLSRPVEEIKPIRRNGAKTGDVIYVTGSLGGSLAGRHMIFTPRIKEAVKIARAVRVHSMMDISDGLSTDLNRICAQSGVGAEIKADDIPLSPQAAKTDDPLFSALNDGEDFELLFTLALEDVDKLPALPDLSITPVGRIIKGSGIDLICHDGSRKKMIPGGFDHL